MTLCSFPELEASGGGEPEAERIYSGSGLEEPQRWTVVYPVMSEFSWQAPFGLEAVVLLSLGLVGVA